MARTLPSGLTMRQHGWRWLTPLLLLAALASCERGESGSGKDYDGYASVARVAREQSAPSSAPAPARARPGVTEAANASAGAQRILDPASLRANAMLIRTATASVEVKALEPAITAARLAAERLGGMVANTAVQTGRSEAHSATLQLKVPSQRFDSLLAGLSPLGRVESVEVTAEDVGEEYVDVEARLANARRLEARLIQLLAARTGRLSDVLSVESELARVRGEIDRAEGRRRFLERNVAVSTLELTLHEPAPLAGGRPGSNPILAAFGEAWRYFVASIAWCIRALGVLMPVGAFVLCGAVAARWVVRRLRAAGVIGG